MTAPGIYAAAEKPAPALWRLRLAVLSASHTTIDAYGAFLAPIVALVLAPRFGLTDAGAANLLSLYVFLLSLGQVFFGYLSDHLGGRKLTIAAPAIAGLTAGSFLLAPSLPLLLVMIVACALAIAAYHPEAVALSGALGGPRRAASTAVFMAAGPVGLSLGPFAITWAAERPEPPLWLPVIGLAVALLLWWAVPSGLIGRRSSSAYREEGVLGVLRRQAKPLSLLGSISALRYLVMTGLSFGIPLLLADRIGEEQALATAGWWLSLLLGSSAVGGILGASLTGGRERSANVASLLLAGALLVAVPLTPVAWGWLPLTAAGLALGWTNPVVIAMGQRVAPAATASVSALLLGGAWTVGGPIAPKLFEVVRDVFSATAAVHWLAGAAFLAGLVSLLLPRRTAA